MREVPSQLYAAENIWCEQCENARAFTRFLGIILRQETFSATATCLRFETALRESYALCNKLGSHHSWSRDYVFGFSFQIAKDSFLLIKLIFVILLIVGYACFSGQL